MKGKRFSDEQVIRILQEADSGLSVTDPCLGWEETRELLEDLARQHGDFLPASLRLGGVR